MKASTWCLSGTAACVFLASLAACASRRSMDELLVNPSFHILVNPEQPGPDLGTFDFETKLFKVADTQNVDLAAADDRICRAIVGVLETKGFRRDTEDPDLLVSYAVALDASISGSDFNAAYAEEFPVAFPELEPHEELNYHQGTLILDFVGRESRELLWRGAIMAEIDMEVSDADRERRSRHVIEILLAHYPKPVQAGGGE